MPLILLKKMFYKFGILITSSIFFGLIVYIVACCFLCPLITYLLW